MCVRRCDHYRRDGVGMSSGKRSGAHFTMLASYFIYNRERPQRLLKPGRIHRFRSPKTASGTAFALYVNLAKNLKCTHAATRHPPAGTWDAKRAVCLVSGNKDR